MSAHPPSKGTPSSGSEALATTVVNLAAWKAKRRQAEAEPPSSELAKHHQAWRDYKLAGSDLECPSSAD